MKTTVVSSRPGVAAYGLARPDLAEAEAAVRRVCGPGADGVWAAVLQRSGVDASDRSDQALLAVIDAMTRRGEPVVALCARALAIRVSSYEHLSATQEIVRGVQG